MNGDSLMMNDELMSMESSALKGFTEARRRGQPLPADVEMLFDTLGIMWDEIEEEYFNLNQVLADSINALLAEHGPQEALEN
jgi:hypothetical protein